MQVGVGTRMFVFEFGEAALHRDVELRHGIEAVNVFRITRVRQCGGDKQVRPGLVFLARPVVAGRGEEAQFDLAAAAVDGDSLRRVGDLETVFAELRLAARGRIGEVVLRGPLRQRPDGFADFISGGAENALDFPVICGEAEAADIEPLREGGVGQQFTRLFRTVARHAAGERQEGKQEKARLHTGLLAEAVGAVL